MKYRTLLRRLPTTITVDALDKRAKVRVMATYYNHGEPHARVIGDARVTNVYAQDNGQPLIAAELDEANLREKLADKGAPHQHAREVRFYPRAVDENAPPDYRYMVDVIMLWLSDSDGAPRMEHGHGETEEEAWKVARAIAAAFMYEDTVEAEEWPQNNIDHVSRATSSGPSQVVNEEEAELRAAFDALVAQGAHESNDGFRLLRRARQLSLDGLASDIKLWLMYAPVEDNPRTGDDS